MQRWRMWAVVCLAMTASVALPAQPRGRPEADGFAHTDGRQILDAAGRPLQLRGTSIGNWLVTE